MHKSYITSLVEHIIIQNELSYERYQSLAAVSNINIKTMEFLSHCNLPLEYKYNLRMGTN